MRDYDEDTIKSGVRAAAAALRTAEERLETAKAHLGWWLQRNEKPHEPRQRARRHVELTDVEAITDISRPTLYRLRDDAALADRCARIAALAQRVLDVGDDGDPAEELPVLVPEVGAARWALTVAQRADFDAWMDSLPPADQVLRMLDAPESPATAALRAAWTALLNRLAAGEPAYDPGAVTWREPAR